MCFSAYSPFRARENGACNASDVLCGVMQGMLALLRDGNLEHFNRYAQPNASYTVLEGGGGQDITLRWGIATHLLKLPERD